MTTMCADQRHSPQLHHLLSGKKTLRDIDIPPRRILGRRPNTTPTSDNFIYLPENPSSEEEALLRKFLPYNNNDDDEDFDYDPYSSDEFRMYEFKVRRCMQSRSHDWNDCPFAHPGEKARRRDPRRFHYSGNVCSDFRRGGCNHGDTCEFAHGVFECWLHPSRYRTQACKDGKNCKRKVYFFSHTPRQLRVLPLNSQSPHQSHSVSSPPATSSNHCCVLCHSLGSSSPTSTLMGLPHFSSPPLSPSLSPPRSPINNGGGFEGSRSCGFSPLSRCNEHVSSSTMADHPSVFNFSQFLPGALTYKDALTELVISSVNFYPPRSYFDRS